MGEPITEGEYDYLLKFIDSGDPEVLFRGYWIYSSCVLDLVAAYENKHTEIWKDPEPPRCVKCHTETPVNYAGRGRGPLCAACFKKKKPKRDMTEAALWGKSRQTTRD